MRAVAVLRIFVLDWHIEQRISGMVDGNIGFSISDMCAPTLSCSIISSPSAPSLKFLKPFSVAAPEKPAVLKTDGDTPIVADFRYFPDFISQSEFAFPAERFWKEFDP